MLCSALRELALRVYDRRAIVVEVVSRLHALQAATAANPPQHELQVVVLLCSSVCSAQAL